MSKELDKSRYVEIREKGIRSMLDSDRSQVQLEGLFQTIGLLEKFGIPSLVLRCLRRATIFIAREGLRWTAEDVEESLESGRQLAKMKRELGGGGNKDAFYKEIDKIFSHLR